MLGEQVARQVAGLRSSKSDQVDAVCVASDWDAGFVTVNIGGAEQVMSWVGSAPYPGDRVRVLTLGMKPVAVVQHGAPSGTVVSASSTLATVNGDDGRTYVYPFRVGDAIVPGDRVRLDHAGRCVALEYTEEPPGSEYEPPPAPPAAAVKARWFYPTDSGNYRFGSYVSQFAEVSENRAAYYWYGTQIASSIPDNATVTRAEIRLVEVWDELPGVVSRLATHTDASSVHSGAAPALSGAITVSGGGTINIASYANALKTGAAYGVGFPAGFGWRRFDSAAKSGAIYMEWSV